MRLLRYIKIWLYRWWSLGSNLQVGIDSHKWESKIEILGYLSRGYY